MFTDTSTTTLITGVSVVFTVISVLRRFSSRIHKRTESLCFPPKNFYAIQPVNRIQAWQHFRLKSATQRIYQHIHHYHASHALSAPLQTLETGSSDWKHRRVFSAVFCVINWIIYKNVLMVLVEGERERERAPRRNMTPLWNVFIYICNAWTKTNLSVLVKHSIGKKNIAQQMGDGVEGDYK